MLGENIKLLRQSHHMTMEQLADTLNRKYPDTINFNKGKLSKWENNREEPRLSSLIIIADYFHVTVDDIVNGDYSSINREEEFNEDISHLYNQLNSVNKERLYEYGEGLLDEQHDLQFVTKNVLEYSTNEDTDSEYVDVLLSGTVAAGTGNYNYGDTETVSIPRNKLPKSDYDVMVKVTGNSMEPAFLDGDYIFIKEVDEFPNGKFAVVIVNNESFLKKVYKEGNRLRLVSLNHDYKDMYFNEYDDIKIVGTVVM